MADPPAIIAKDNADYIWIRYSLHNPSLRAERRFPPPWSVEELDACFVVRDWGVCLSAPQMCYVLKVSGDPYQHAAITPGAK
jgi:hypothetical protein